MRQWGHYGLHMAHLGILTWDAATVELTAASDLKQSKFSSAAAEMCAQYTIRLNGS